MPAGRPPLTGPTPKPRTLPRAAPSEAAASGAPARPEAMSVAELTDRLKGVLEGAFPSVWVAGEVSNFSRPSSGHCYFTLKDDQAQLRAVVWRGAAEKLGFPLRDGVEIVCHGRVELYGPRGTYQIVIDRAEALGAGALEERLRRLREKLAAEGLFDAERKRPLPPFPRRIGFVTSPTGAAVRDFLEVVRRRWRGVHVLVIPARVQGDGAAEEIAAGVRLANRLATPLDVLVVGRGGGSLEDLWAFNEEVVVRAIHASQVPVVSAVGHEIDVTLADFVADVRALTPSEAAERVVPSADEMMQRLSALGGRLSQGAWRSHRRLAERLRSLASRRPLARPHTIVGDLARRLDELDARARRASLQAVATNKGRLAALAGKLETLSPLQVLGRGYSLTTTAEGKLVRAAHHVKPGERLVTTLGEGRVHSTVDSIEAK
ncbi:MAG: exodeoxyribonuclease VII large subunit [Lacipirellulaceae bacterium]